ncbi:MAG: hypothetical protein ACE5G8_17635 [Anaerolineae bacterium]
MSFKPSLVVKATLLALVFAVAMAGSALAYVHFGTLTGVLAGKKFNGTFSNGDTKRPWAGVIELTLQDPGGTKVGSFCTDIHRTTSKNVKYALSDEPVSCEILYLLSTYPPEKTGLTNTQGAMRQAAVWHFSDQFDVNPTLHPTLAAQTQALID